jgi:uncharacterized protein YjbI with pentapeptide repeats
MTRELLAEIFFEHKKWLRDDGGKRADLSYADLSRANLSGADLSRANLSRADLSGANLSGADLSYANLSGTDLSRANLSGANLSYANLSGTDLSGANLSRANLSRANLSRADLSRANLSYADLSYADLSYADLSGTDLSGANLSRANLSGAKINYQIEDGLLLRVSCAALSRDDALEMRTWHTCETTHCIAGWACHLAKNGKELEGAHGTQIAGLLLLGAEAHSHFFDHNETARQWLQSIVDAAEQKAK